jgi:hypothetical protein
MKTSIHNIRGNCVEAYKSTNQPAAAKISSFGCTEDTILYYLTVRLQTVTPELGKPKFCVIHLKIRS